MECLLNIIILLYFLGHIDRTNLPNFVILCLNSFFSYEIIKMGVCLLLLEPTQLDECTSMVNSLYSTEEVFILEF
ncbi:hypothetical protein GLYMA_06G306351v4 [Glycine max]|nr:hypothetical protein GLYMA_06G306351v4 [Glycine max]KAH1128307.1 hypothetical protein GYH30_016737 [Glycine max]